MFRFGVVLGAFVVLISLYLVNDKMVAVSNELAKDNKVWQYGADTIQGRRQYQEDRLLIADSNQTLGLFGVFDGHGGSKASEFAKRNFYKFFSDHLSVVGDVQQALKLSLLQVEDMFMERAERENLRDGSTACVAAVTPDAVIVANLGDTKGLVCKGSEVVELSKDHHPEVPEEKSRIDAAGGFVLYTAGGIFRVNGNLAVSRAIGDKDLKPFGVIAEPEFMTYARNADENEASYLVILSDGIVEAMRVEDVCRAVTRAAPTEKSLNELASEVTKLAYDSGSYDNLSIIIVPL